MVEKNLLPADGEAYYYPSFFSVAERAWLWEGLERKIAWKQEPIVIMGKRILQPRLTAWYGDAGKSYGYSGIRMEPLSWTEELLFTRERIMAASGAAFNSALLNYYRDGQDSMGWHRDNERELGSNPVIGSVTFGVSRHFHFRHYRDKSLKIKQLLEDGSFLLMRGTTQHNWLHSIPKEQGVTGGRINITFRNIL